MAKSYPGKTRNSYTVNKTITSSPKKMRKYSSMDSTVMYDNIKHNSNQKIQNITNTLKSEDNLPINPINVVVVNIDGEKISESKTNESKNLLLSSLSSNYGSSTRSSMTSTQYEDSLTSSHRDSHEVIDGFQTSTSQKQPPTDMDSIKEQCTENEQSSISLGRSNRSFVMDETLQSNDKQSNFQCDVIRKELNKNIVIDNPLTYNPNYDQCFNIDNIDKIEELIPSNLEQNNNYVDVTSDDNEKPKFRSEKCFFNLLVDGDRSTMIINNEYMAYEPEFLSMMIQVPGKDKKKNKKQLAYDETNRVTIKLSDIITTWICNCETSLSTLKPKKSKLKKNGDFSTSICDCMKDQIKINETLNSPTTKKLIDPSDVKPFVVKVFYVEQTKNNTCKLNYIILDADEEAVEENSYLNETIETDSGQIQHINLNTKRRNNLLGEVAYKIRTKLEINFQRPKRLLLFINPFGGFKQAQKVFEQVARPILELSRIESTVIVTERADHAKDFIIDKDNDIEQFDGIICIGGDGMFGEILNGTLIRTQQTNNINYNSIDAQLLKPSFKLGVIPAGSTDAVVYSTCGDKNPMNSILSIVLGKTLNIDVGAVHYRDEQTLIRYAATFMGYGFFGDTLLESERLRWMGPKRYDFAGIRRFFKHKVYSGEIKLCLEPSDGSPKDYNPCGINCSNCITAASKSRGKLNVDDAPACISIRGRFLAINSAIMSCRCAKSQHGMSPMAHVGNGCADLILVSKCSRFQFLKYLLNLIANTKKTFDYDFIDLYRVREFEFNPIIVPQKRKGYMFEKSADCDFFEAFDSETINPVLSDEQSSSSNHDEQKLSISNHQKEAKRSKKNAKILSALSPSVWNCDGEIITETAIHCKIHCQLVEIFAPGFDVGRSIDGQWN